MGLIDFIEAWSGPYSNFSCRSRTLEGFERCYDYVSGNPHYYDNGYDYKSHLHEDVSADSNNTNKVTFITEEYTTEYIRFYKKRMKRLRLWKNIVAFMSIAGTAGLIFPIIYVLIFCNIESFIVLGVDIFVTIISLVIWSELIKRVFRESDSVLDVWLKRHPEFK